MINSPPGANKWTAWEVVEFCFLFISLYLFIYFFISAQGFRAACFHSEVVISSSGSGLFPTFYMLVLPLGAHEELGAAFLKLFLAALVSEGELTKTLENHIKPPLWNSATSAWFLTSVSEILKDAAEIFRLLLKSIQAWVIRVFFSRSYSFLCIYNVSS